MTDQITRILAIPATLFDGDGSLSDPVTVERSRELLDAFDRWIRLVQPDRSAESGAILETGAHNGS
jgi:hypothetical protein